MTYIWEERNDLKGSELYCAIAIADHADADGYCFPGIKTIAMKMRLKDRQVQDLIKRLETKNVFDVIRGNGRGNLTCFKFKRVQDSTSFIETERVQDSAKKGAGFCKKRVQDSAFPIYKEEPFKEPIHNQSASASEKQKTALSLADIESGAYTSAKTETKEASPPAAAFDGFVAECNRILEDQMLLTPFNFTEWEQTILYIGKYTQNAEHFRGNLENVRSWAKTRITPKIVANNYETFAKKQQRREPDQIVTPVMREIIESNRLAEQWRMQLVAAAQPDQEAFV